MYDSKTIFLVVFGNVQNNPERSVCYHVTNDAMNIILSAKYRPGISKKPEIGGEIFFAGDLQYRMFLLVLIIS